jgi:hypothetical protein
MAAGCFGMVDWLVLFCFYRKRCKFCSFFTAAYVFLICKSDVLLEPQFIVIFAGAHVEIATEGSR